MPGVVQIPDLERQLASIIARVEALERKRPGFGPPDVAPGGALTSMLYLLGTDSGATTAGYVFPLTEELRQGAEDVTVSGSIATIANAGIYTISAFADCIASGASTAGGWYLLVDLYSDMRPTAGGNFFGPTANVALVNDSGSYYGNVTLAWTGFLDAGDTFRLMAATYAETGNFTFTNGQVWVARLGDAPE